MFFKLANTFMRGAAFLGATNPNEDIIEGANNISVTVIDTISSVLGAILGIVGAAGVIWAIVLGINMARADSTEKREEAKKRLISVIVGIVIMIVLVVFFLVGFKPMLEAFGVDVVEGTKPQA